VEPVVGLLPVAGVTGMRPRAQRVLICLVGAPSVEVRQLSVKCGTRARRLMVEGVESLVTQPMTQRSASSLLRSNEDAIVYSNAHAARAAGTSDIASAVRLLLFASDSGAA